MFTKSPRHARQLAPKGRARPGFTLVEILTATAIMALVVSLVMTILSQVMTAWDQSTNKLTMSSDARAVLDIISQDLQSAIFRHDSQNSQWMALNTNDVGGPYPVGSSKLADSTKFSRLIFYSDAPLHPSKDSGTPGKSGNPIYGDFCLIEYRVQYADPFGTTAQGPKTYTFTLHRVVVDPATTFYGLTPNEPLMGLTTHSTTGKGATTDLMTVFDSLIDTANANGVNSAPPAGLSGAPLTITVKGAGTTDSAILSNIGQFTVRLYFYTYFKTNDPPLQVYETDIGDPSDLHQIPSDAGKYYFGGWPTTGNAANVAGYIDSLYGSNIGNFVSMAYADITLTIVNEDGIALMQQNSGAMPEGFTWPQFIQQYGSTYTQRVQFVNKPQ